MWTYLLSFMFKKIQRAITQAETQQQHAQFSMSLTILAKHYQNL